MFCCPSSLRRGGLSNDNFSFLIGDKRFTTNHLKTWLEGLSHISFPLFFLDPYNLTNIHSVKACIFVVFEQGGVDKTRFFNILRIKLAKGER